MGNDGSERRFNGTIDSMTFATRALSAAEVLQLTCLSQQPTVTVPSELPATPVGVPVSFDIALTNNNPVGACAPMTFNLQTFDTGLVLDPPPFTPTFSDPVPSGQTGHMTITATAPASADPGDQLPINFLVVEPTTQFFGFEQVPFVVAASAGCQVSTPSSTGSRTRSRR